MNILLLLSNGAILDPYGLPFPKIGVRNRNPKLQSLLSQERVMLRSANLAVTLQGPSEQKPMNHLREKRAWAYPGIDCRNFLSTPYYLRNG